MTASTRPAATDGEFCSSATLSRRPCVGGSCVGGSCLGGSCVEVVCVRQDRATEGWPTEAIDDADEENDGPGNEEHPGGTVDLDGLGGDHGDDSESEDSEEYEDDAFHGENPPVQRLVVRSRVGQKTQ